MGFFLETLFGGLMAGMLYSLVALGFVLIFKASGVFNFAQGAMVLFAALAMARFAEWVPDILGLDSDVAGSPPSSLRAPSSIFSSVLRESSLTPGMGGRASRFPSRCQQRAAVAARRPA